MITNEAILEAIKSFYGFLCICAELTEAFPEDFNNSWSVQSSNRKFCVAWDRVIPFHLTYIPTTVLSYWKKLWVCARCGGKSFNKHHMSENARDFCSGAVEPFPLINLFSKHSLLINFWSHVRASLATYIAKHSQLSGSDFEIFFWKLRPWFSASS